MNEWTKQFWQKHGERLVFMLMAFILSLVFWFGFPDMKDAAKTILIGIAMLCFNKARSGGNGGGNGSAGS